MFGAGFLRRRVNLSPRALTSATSPMSSAANDPSLGSSARSIARSNAAAVTGSFDGGEKPNPDRILNVYVRPSGEMAGCPRATSGRSLAPSGNGRSG